VAFLSGAAPQQASLRSLRGADQANCTCCTTQGPQRAFDRAGARTTEMDSAGHPTLPRVPSNDDYSSDPEVGRLDGRCGMRPARELRPR
jgi:hypothetical protein